jgi:P27 family predicted phage terminase small subunit
MTQEPEYTGKRGRKGLTEQQKKDKSPANADPRGLKVDSFLPMPPDNVEADVAAEWQRVGEYLLLTDRVSKLDSQALLMYATSYVVYADTMRDLLIGRKALWGEVNGRPKPSKIADLAIKHGEIVLRLARKFGMTARTRHLDHSSGCGRPATPQQIHDLRGTVPERPRKIPNKIEQVQWEPDSVACPAWFSSAATAEWSRLIGQLTAVELWTPLDVGPISLACASYTLAAKCAAQLLNEQLVLPVRDSEAVVEHPLGVIYERHFALCEQVWQDYGMSPYDRQQFRHVEGEQQGRLKLKVFPGEMA